MRTSAIIPCRLNPRDTWRKALLDFVVTRLENSGLVDEVVCSDSDLSRSFNRAQARNNAVAKATGDLFVVCDGDTFTDNEFLELALASAAYNDSWAFPYGKYYNLTKPATIERLWSPDLPLERPVEGEYEHELDSFGGMYAITRSAWDRVGGYPTAFRGWGYEDNSFACAAETFLGRPYRVSKGFVCHLWHYAPETVRFDQPEIEFNRRIFYKFRDAVGEKKLMRTLCQKYR